MEGPSSEFDFGELQEQAAWQSAAEERFAVLQARLYTALADRGVVLAFASDRQDAVAMYDEFRTAADAEAEHRGKPLSLDEELELAASISPDTWGTVATVHQIDNNQVWLAMLCASIGEYQYGLETGAPQQPYFKKELQAQYLIETNDRIWLDVIDQEIPGEPLDEGADGVFITNTRASHELTRWQLAEYEDNVRAAFEDLLATDNAGALTNREKLAIYALTDQFCLHARRDDGRLAVVWPEEVRTLLLSSGIEMRPGWERIIRFVDKD